MLLRSGYKFLMLVGLFGLSFIAASGSVFIEDEEPEITDRVARISAISGEASIRRADSDEWEKAVLNLPIVEGDEIVTDNNGRVELQFTANKHVRLAANTSIKIVTLVDEGIALSVSQGTISTRLNEFDPQAGYFEIDAPKTTVALLASGQYRIDAGDVNETEVTVSVGSEGEARIYSSTSGFTLRSGRSAKVSIAGDRAGDWETGVTSMIGDSFDNWVRDREDIVARLLKNAYYDRYYDNDIYGAEDLNDNGEWIHTLDYGYVWRPYNTAINSYADWSPYRYGQWRWVPPYGWTWINDEPWGWATYHHGRWIWYNNFWHWSPYGYYRYSRSWWRPALVYITFFNNNICWYPLPYRYRYYNFNHHYYAKHPRNKRDPRNPRTPVQNPPVSPQQGQPSTGGPLTGDQTAREITPPIQTVPTTGVVTVPADQFGSRKAPARPPLTTAREILSKKPDDGQSMTLLPIFAETKPKIDAEIRVKKPEIAKTTGLPVTGATTRTAAKPLDTELKTTRILGSRPQLENAPAVPTPTTRQNVPSPTSDPRKTGAVERPVRTYNEPKTSGTAAPAVRQPRTPSPAQPPVRGTESKPQTNVRPSSPPSSSGVPQQQPRETPRYTPPPTQSRPAQPSEKPRSAPAPSRPSESPRSQPAPSKPAPSRPAESPKSQPSKPAPESKKKDG